MAFMMPVMKNNFEIYKDTRSRKTSECSNASSNGAGASAASGAAGAGMPPSKGRQRKSESFATSPLHTQRMQMQRCQSQRTFPRNASKSSQGSVSATISPTRSFCQSSNTSPQKTATTSTTNTSSQNDLTKFHWPKHQQNEEEHEVKQPTAPAAKRSEATKHRKNEKGNEDDEKKRREICKSNIKAEPVARKDTRLAITQTPDIVKSTSINSSSVKNSPKADLKHNCGKIVHATNMFNRPSVGPGPINWRLTAVPLVRAQLNKCNRKLAKLHLHCTGSPLTSHLLLTSGSTINLFTSSSEASNMHSHQEIGPTAIVGEQSQLLQQPGLGQETQHAAVEKPNRGRTKSKRKRLPFLRRSSSRFSTKSTPG
uniref:Uncharacterized protein n=1 Tax=Glossina pallidipes TaxID=7398 RepID=A0A1B0AC47_GLOPL